jgi:hypothetical protein
MNDQIRKRCLRGLLRVRHSPRNFGTAFLVEDTHIITAAHCLSSWPIHGEYFPGEQTVSARIVGHRENGSAKLEASAIVTFVDPVSDLAILCGNDEKLCQDFDTLCASVDELPIRLRQVPASERSLREGSGTILAN